MLRRLVVIGALAALGTLAAPSVDGAEPEGASTDVAEKPWCAPELETVGQACYVPYQGDDTRGPTTLVVFLHGLMGDGTRWHFEQQRLMARMAQAYGFSALIPKGELGIGPARVAGIRAWPTTAELQDRYEQQMIDSWWSAKRRIERREGRFLRTLVFGFSNGAYFAASLALRGRLDIDGYGVFAGGSGGKLARFLGSQTTHRVPIFVGYGTKDPHHRGQRSLVSALKTLSWPHQSKASNAGHTVTDEQIRRALKFLKPLERDQAASERRAGSGEPAVKKRRSDTRAGEPRIKVGSARRPRGSAK